MQIWGCQELFRLTEQPWVLVISHIPTSSLESFPILDKKQHTPDTPKQSSQRTLLQFEVEKSLGLNRDPQTKIQPWLRPGAASWARRAAGNIDPAQSSASSHRLCFPMELVGVTSSKHNWKKKGRNVQFRFPYLSLHCRVGVGIFSTAQHWGKHRYCTLGSSFSDVLWCFLSPSKVTVHKGCLLLVESTAQ